MRPAAHGRLPHRRGGALALLGVVLAAVLPIGPVLGQSSTEEPGYDFLTLHALADGVTVDFNIEGFLPIEDLVGLSSITSESHFGAGRSDSLAALPDPGDLILTLPGTLSALAGVSGIPDYPAAASADSQSNPVDDVQLFPDAGVGAGRLHAEAAEDGSSAFAHVGRQVDTVGLLPSFSIGSVRTTARTIQLGPTRLESVATTTVSDVRLLGGLVSIDQITSEVSTGILNDVPEAAVDEVMVTGATIAGTPVGITEEGIVGLGSAVPLAPVVDALVQPLLAEGISIRTTPSSKDVGDRTAVARGGGLQISVDLDVQGYPGVLTMTLGRALAELEVGALSEGGGLGVGGTDPLPSGGLDGSGSFLPPSADGVPGIPSGLPVDASLTPAGGSAGVIEVVSVPVGRLVEDWDVTTLYRVLLLGALALFAAGRLIVRSAVRPARRPNDLRQLWRW